MKNIFSTPFYLGRKVLFILILSSGACMAAESTTSADDVQVKEVGEPVVRNYLSADGSNSAKASESGTPAENHLMVMAGTFANSSSYEWKGSGKRDAVAQANYGVTYLAETWHNIDVNLRAEVTTFRFDDQSPSKISFLPLFTIPLAETDFPWYFGLGAGPGVFINQVPGYSPISLDYQLVTGFRFPHLIENAGLVIEAGVKNHLLLLSSGQLNALALDVGATFAF